MANRAAATLFLAVYIFQTALCQVAEKGLQCYQCGFDQTCAETPVTCKPGERCGTILGHSDYKVHETISRKDCIPAQKCGVEDRLTDSGSPFRISYSCCKNDFCNTGTSGASHTFVTHLPLLFVATALAILLTFLC